MKLLIVSLLSIFQFFSSVKEEPKDKINVKGPLTFNNTKFQLAWTGKPNENYYVQEYLPQNEELGKFNQMLTINVFITEINAKNAVEQKIKELEKRKATDPICNYQINESPDGKEFIIDFLLGESKDNKMTIAEFNAYRYKQIELEKGKKAIIVYAYSKRSYADKINDFLKNLGKERVNNLNSIISTELPQIKIQN
ncbi:MAG: hypothetical protein EOO87_04495 [Pedobacter sp.]|nr:MAG: hypothetical protein EOO87_04495 [Pedobacter sp.]